jgi:hypothetical protein
MLHTNPPLTVLRSEAFLGFFSVFGPAFLRQSVAVLGATKTALDDETVFLAGEGASTRAVNAGFHDSRQSPKEFDRLSEWFSFLQQHSVGEVLPSHFRFCGGMYAPVFVLVGMNEEFDGSGERWRGYELAESRLTTQFDILDETEKKESVSKCMSAGKSAILRSRVEKELGGLRDTRWLCCDVKSEWGTMNKSTLDEGSCL